MLVCFARCRTGSLHINISVQKEVDKPTRLLQFVAFVYLPFSFRSLDVFVASLLFRKKTKTLSKFFPRLLRFYYVLFYLVCSVLLIFGLVGDTGVSSVLSIS